MLLRYALIRLDQPHSNRDHVARQEDNLLTCVVQDKPSLPGNTFDDCLVPNACAFLYEDTPSLPSHPGAENRQEFMGRKSIKKSCVTRFHSVYKGTPQARRAKALVRRVKFPSINAMAIAQGFWRWRPGQIQPDAGKNALRPLLDKDSRDLAVFRQKIIRPLHLHSPPNGAQRLCKQVAEHQRPKIVPQHGCRGACQGRQHVART